MYVIHEMAMPSGAQASIHRLTQIIVTADQIEATVNSHASTESQMIVWQDRHIVPPGAMTADVWQAVHDWLISPVGPFAGGEIMVDPTPFEAARAEAWARIKFQRAAVEAGGADTPFGRVDTDMESLLRITGAVQAASIARRNGDTLTLDWTMEDNSIVTLDAPSLVAMGRAVALHVDAVHQHGRMLRDLIEAVDPEAPDAIEQLAAIQWGMELPE